MILFVNVFITESRWASYDRHQLPPQDRLDIFKYSLGSLSSIPHWSKVVIYCQLDTPFMHRWGELGAYIYSIFPKGKVSIHCYRNCYQWQWRKAMERLRDEPDDLVWFTCNDDHIFIDYDLTVLDSLINALKNRDRKFVSGYFSHFPEMVRNSVGSPTAEIHENYFTFEHPDVDSIQILPKDVLFSWWFDHDYADAWMPRTDTWGGTWVQSETIKVHIPFRELCRHFDGYGHTSVDYTRCPPLQIPGGYFSGDMKVIYCGERTPEHLLINPISSCFAVVDPNGADCRFMLEDMPFFWKGKVKTLIDQSYRYKPEEILEARNKVVWELINADMRPGLSIPNEECVKIFMR